MHVLLDAPNPFASAQTVQPYMGENLLSARNAHLFVVRGVAVELGAAERRRRMRRPGCTRCRGRRRRAGSCAGSMSILSTTDPLTACDGMYCIVHVLYCTGTVLYR